MHSSSINDFPIKKGKSQTILIFLQLEFHSITFYSIIHTKCASFVFRSRATSKGIFIRQLFPYVRPDVRRLVSFLRILGNNWETWPGQTVITQPRPLEQMGTGHPKSKVMHGIKKHAFIPQFKIAIYFLLKEDSHFTWSRYLCELYFL